MKELKFDTAGEPPVVGQRAYLRGVQDHPYLDAREVGQDGIVLTSAVQSIARHTETGKLAITTRNTLYVQR